jgi:PTS system mannose-specific IIA component
MRAVAIGPNDDMEERRADIIDAVRTVDRGDGVVILTDMFGGTPSNLAISVINQVRTEVIAGVNLPMLIKLAEVRDKLGLPEAALAAQDAGRRYIRVASVELAGGAA